MQIISIKYANHYHEAAQGKAETFYAVDTVFVVFEDILFVGFLPFSRICLVAKSICVSFSRFAVGI